MTYKGLIVLTCFEILECIIDNSILPEDYLNKFSSMLSKNANLNFNRVWEQLKSILFNKNILYTLKKEKINKVVKFDDTGIVIKTEKGEDKISIDKIEEAWTNFVEKGYLQHNDYVETSFRSSFILTLFSQLPYVKVNEGPPLSIKLMTSF